MIGSSTWKLPLLLVLLSISFHLSSSARKCRGLNEFSKDLKVFEDSVKNCSKNCSSIHITDRRCKCLNLSMSQGEYTPPGYFKAGLESLFPTSSNQETITRLINFLERMVQPCQKEIEEFSKLMKYEPVISPKSLHMKLKDMIEVMNFIHSNATK